MKYCFQEPNYWNPPLKHVDSFSRRINVDCRFPFQNRQKSLGLYWFKRKNMLLFIMIGFGCHLFKMLIYGAYLSHAGCKPSLMGDRNILLNVVGNILSKEIEVNYYPPKIHILLLARYMIYKGMFRLCDGITTDMTSRVPTNTQ